MKTKQDVIDQVDAPHIAKTPLEQSREKLRKFMEEETKLVKGIFRCYENPGATEKVTVKKYPTPAEMSARGQMGGVPPFEKMMADGHTYEVPLYVARFLNGTDATATGVNGKINSCSYPIHGFTWDKNAAMPPPSTTGMDGSPVPLIVPNQFKRRYGFDSLEFNAS